MAEHPRPPTIFDRKRRIAARDRAHCNFAAHDFLYRHMLEGLLERLGDVTRIFHDVLLVGCPDNSAREALLNMGKKVTCCDPGGVNSAAIGGIQSDEDALPFAPDSFDLILACDTLDSVNDLPGALIVMRRILRPDGLLLGACVGAGSLVHLKEALLRAEGDHPSPHIHPQIDVRAAGDLLARAGYVMPVADTEKLTVRYPTLLTLMRDLRGMGHSNVMTSARSGVLSRQTIADAAQHFAAAAESDYKIGEIFNILYLSGWKPDPSQPLPARRGSGRVSLADALKHKA